MRLSSRLASILLFAGSSLAAAAAAELVLRVAYPQPLDASYVWPDGTLRHLPSFRYTYTRAGFANQVRYNALGLRGPEPAPAKIAGTERVALLGDSFVEGKQVGEDQVLTAVLERLAASRGLRLEVLNAGMGGYGTADQLLLWERALAALRPDLVLVACFPNDVRNNVDRAWFDLRDGLVVQVAEPPRPRIRWLYEGQKFLVSRLHLAYLVKDAVRTLTGTTPDQREPAESASGPALLEDEDVFLVRPPPRIERGWTLTLALLSELARRVEASGARVAVVLVPSRYQVDAGLWRAHTQRLGLDPTAFDMDLPRRRFDEWSVQTGVAVLDLLPELRRQNRANSFYYETDAHWNAAGHRVAAQALLRELLARGLLRPAPGGS